MRRYPFTVPGFARLTQGGGPGIVDRLRGALEPLVMSFIKTLAPDLRCRAVTTDAIHTLGGEEFPKEWWVRTSFVLADVPDGADAEELAWLSVEYSQWEESETWAVQAFLRVAEVEFSIGADSDGEPDVLQLRGVHLPSGDVTRIGDLLTAHFGAGSTTS
jgi:hypothetical protein